MRQDYYNPKTGNPVYFDPKTGQQVDTSIPETGPLPTLIPSHETKLSPVEEFNKTHSAPIAGRGIGTERPIGQGPESIISPLTEPLSTIPSDLAHSITSSDLMSGDDPRARFGRGAINFIGDALSNVTSPAGIATLGGSALEKAGLSTAGNMLMRGGSVPFVAHGTEQMVNPESSISERLMGGLEAAGGMFGMRHEVNPVEELTNRLRKNTVIPPSTESFNPEEMMSGPGINGEVSPNTVTSKPVFPGQIESPTTWQSIRAKIQSNEPPVIPLNVDPIIPPEFQNTPKPHWTESRAANWYKQASGAFKTLLSTIDLSAPRQSSGFMFHPEYWKNFGTLLKNGWKGTEALDILKQTIKEDPSGLFQQNIKLNNGKMTSIAEQAGLDLSKHSVNERFVNKWMEKGRFNPIGMSSRSFEAYTLKMRADMFKKFYKQFEAEGLNNPESNKTIARAVNTNTGTSGIGDLERSKSAMFALNEGLFAPRFNLSRIKTYTQVLDPRNYQNVPKSFRLEALKSLLGVVSTGVAMGQLAKFGGAEVVTDPSSSDFLKIKIGNTRIDPFRGLQQYPVAVMKTMIPQMFGGGYSTSPITGRTSDLSNPKFGGQSRLSVLEKFAQNKAAPIPAMIMDWMSGTQYDGTPYSLKQSLAEHITPIVIQDLMDLYKEDPSLIPPLLLPIIFGQVNLQTYGR